MGPLTHPAPLLERIEQRQPFAFSRFGDGEWMLMSGGQFETQDDWHAPGGETGLSRAVKAAFLVQDVDYFLGFDCLRCNPQLNQSYKEMASQGPEYYVCKNLFVNQNYRSFCHWLKRLREEVVLVGNERCRTDKLPFPVKELIPVGSTCVQDFERPGWFESLVERLAGHQDSLIFSCAGPLTNTLIHQAWQRNRSNRYVDVGSALDEYLFHRKTRPYMSWYSPYRWRRCEF